ncbi:hypothetical protein EV363DRAFT_1402332 [Boletus edulis]|nr:hypothetical protein EV363DRAFT_1402332 [Boletus edulis]
MVLDQLPFPTIANFAASSIAHRQGVTILFCGCLRTFANQFFAFPYLFMDALIGAGGVVSGSGTLHIIFALETRGWEASDLDVYIPCGKVAIITNFLFILAFHLMALMNYVTPLSIFSAYAVVNPILFDRGQLTLPTCLALAKYQNRGFQIWSTSHTNNNHCVYIQFGRQLYEECEYEAPKVVDWCLGGHLCNFTLGYQTPYVLVRCTI